MVLNEHDPSLNSIPESFRNVHYEFEDQEAFCKEVMSAELPPYTSYANFAKRFPDSSVDSVTRILGFLHFYKEKRYRDNKVNIINYVTTVAEGKLKAEISNENRGLTENLALKESLDNFSSVVVEQPIAEVSKREKRECEWNTVVLPDGGKQMRLVSSSSDMDSILVGALRSTQPADFEFERYNANLKNYRALQKARENGDYRPFIEFSPSPKLTPEAKARGYFGMDTIFIYRYDTENNKEVIEQRWLKAQKEDYWKLIGELESQQYMYLSDAAIMQRSRFVNNSEEEKIKNFIDDNNGKFVEQPELERFRYEELQPKIKKMVEPILEIAAQKMILGLPIEKELAELEATGAYLQYLLREKVKKLLGVDKTRIVISYEEKNRLENDRAYLTLFVEENKKKMPLGGCGGNNGEDSNGRITSMLDVFKDEHGSLKFKCPVCKEIHERPRGELLSVCISSKPEYRGRSIPQC